MNDATQMLGRILNRLGVPLATSSSALNNIAPPSDNGATRARSTAGDEPVRRLSDDLLGRGIVATSFARNVLALDASNGLVVGVLAPWGYGKTSFVNLARLTFESEDITVLDFNPWMFSGADQLVESFFTEIGAQLKVRPGLSQIGDSIAEYGEAFSGLGWLPLVGPWIERGKAVSNLVSKVLKRRKEGTGKRRAKLENALANLSKPLVVVLDDIDRLTTAEIRDVFRLVRLTANFPNLIYVVAFDRIRVETALTDQGVPGRDYLEKILQLTVDIPALPEHALNQQVFAALNDAISSSSTVRSVDDQTWPDIYMEIVRPLLRNMRDVRRYAASVRGTVRDLGDQIALADLLGLEAVRIFLPDVFSNLAESVKALTTTERANKDDKLRVEHLVTAGQQRGSVVKAMITRLFPAAQQHISNMHYGTDFETTWLKARRVAHTDVLRLYLERIAGAGLQAFDNAARAKSYMSNADALDRFLRSIEPSGIQDVISALEIFEGNFIPDEVEPTSVVLLNLRRDLPNRQRAMLELDTRLVVTRVVLRLLRSVEDPGALEAAVRRIMPQLNSLSAQLDLLTIVGYREGAGHKLISKSAAEELDLSWRDALRSTSIDSLVSEPEPFLVLLTARRDSGSTEEPVVVRDSALLTHAILRSARGESLSQPFDSRAIRRSMTLPWDALVELFGTEELLKSRIADLSASSLCDEDLVKLAEKYAKGWRPTLRDH